MSGSVFGNGGISRAAAATLFHPGYASGTFIGLRDIGAPAATTYAADTLYAFPIPIYSPVTVDQLTINCTTGVVACLGRMGVYSHASGAPATLLATTGDIDLSTIAVKDAALAASALLPVGLVWLAALFNGAAQASGYLTNGTTATPVNDLFGGAASSFITASTASGRNTRFVRTAAATFASGLPATFGAGTRGAGSPGAPIITARVV
jgi:hypothetical protein